MSESSLRYKDNPRPSNLLGDTIDELEYCEMMLLDYGDIRSAKRSLSTARQNIWRLSSAMREHYEMSPQQIEEFVGSSITDLNESITEQSSELAAKVAESERTGQFTVERSFLKELKKNMERLEVFHDITQGIENDEVEYT